MGNAHGRSQLAALSCARVLQHRRVIDGDSNGSGGGSDGGGGSGDGGGGSGGGSHLLHPSIIQKLDIAMPRHMRASFDHSSLI